MIPLKKNLLFPLLLSLTVACIAPENKPRPAQDSPKKEKHKKEIVPDADHFLGEVRGDVKTSVSASPADTFLSLKDYHRWLKSDEYMHKKTDARFNNSPRTPEEDHNVCIRDVYIFGVLREDDNDFHVILGNSSSPDKDHLFMTAEISGLPDSAEASFAVLAAVRQKFKDYFGIDAQKNAIFTASKKHPPIHLAFICGSLFFDNHHYGAGYGIGGFNTHTCWEIHPVTNIQFAE